MCAPAPEKQGSETCILIASFKGERSIQLANLKFFEEKSQLLKIRGQSLNSDQITSKLNSWGIFGVQDNSRRKHKI